MANKYFSGEKAPREEAISKLMQHVAGLFDGRFLARITSDDGGPHVTLYLEVENPNLPIEPFLRDALHNPKWMGWRFIIAKCPPGYVDGVLLSKKKSDY
jgi:hypothetical protein